MLAVVESRHKQIACWHSAECSTHVHGKLCACLPLQVHCPPPTFEGGGPHRQNLTLVTAAAQKPIHRVLGLYPTLLSMCMCA
jgi:hypothetical protein